MIKRFFLTLSLLAGLLSPSFGAGTVTMSLTQRFDNSSHLPLSGGLMYFIQAGTTSTPQSAYQDSALTIPYANPLTLDSGGNVPQLFFADGVIKIRITNSLGIQQLIQDNIQVTGASSGGGGGGTVDPTTIFQTGALMPFYGTGVRSGFVRANGRTIGSATSGATERANADTQTLYEYLWNTDANLVVSTGRGASSAADWAANKTIALPDWRGRSLAFLDDMGNSSAGRLTATYFGAATGALGTTLGAAGGSEKHLLTIAQLPASPPNDGTTTNTLVVAHPMQGNIDGGTSNPLFFRFGNNTSASTTNPINPTGTVTVTGNLGGGAFHPIMSPVMLATIYVKL